MNLKLPRCMGTQHPDNVNPPFFAESPELGGEDEVQEAFYSFSHLGCDEQMWDCEGKEVDDFVVRKLLTKYEYFFREKILGKDIFLTLRVPNPLVEKAEAKILLETLESIPRSFDASKLFYNDDHPPIFEVILPMTTSYLCLERVYRYYCNFVVGKQNKPCYDGDITIAEWIGEFKPERINVIPLFEDMEHMLDSHNITRDFLKNKKVDYQRVFLARSDTAMNYGFISALILNKIALYKLHKLSEETGINIYPILGVGSAPFRGNLRPQTIDRISNEYPSVHTFTIQSAFKYDNPPDIVREAINKLRERNISVPHELDENKCMEIIKKYIQEYRKQLIELAPIINKVAKFVPSRRKRKLHIGLFGYSRNVEGITLPRAITFTCAQYSIGVPPEILGLTALNKEDIKFIKECYINFEDDLRDALKFVNLKSKFIPEELKRKINDLLNFEINEEHEKIVDLSIKALEENKLDDVKNHILRAAQLRRFLG